MITYSTGNSTSSSFVVTFDYTPDDVNYGGITHYARGRTDRHGIWEGVRLSDSWYRIDNGPWISTGGASRFSVTTSKNGTKIQARAYYEIKTMGFHWDNQSYPFFYFGTNNAYKGGSSWSSVTWPDNRYLYSNFAKLDSSWSKNGIWWSGWCERNASSGSTQWRGNKEYRNGQSGSQGWRSDRNVGSSGSVQEYRKSVMMSFTKYYESQVVVSSGIVTKPDAPLMEVPYRHGDEGMVRLTYRGPNRDISGKIWVRCECNGKNHDIATWDTSPTFWHDWVKTYYVDFVSAFGEDSRGHDVIYVCRAMNEYGIESSQVRQGVQRFNGRPTTPSYASISLYGNSITVSWGSSSDPDGDPIQYRVHLYARNGGDWSQKEMIWTNSLAHNFNVSSDRGGTEYRAEVWAHDGRIFSRNCARTGTVKKTYPAVKPTFLYPNNTVHSLRPRIIANIKGGPEGGNVITYVRWKNRTYNNRSNPELFNISYSSNQTRYDHTIVFCPPANSPASIGNNSVEMYINNGYEDSPTLYENIVVSSINDVAKLKEYVDSKHVVDAYNMIKNDAKAYGYNLRNVTLPAKRDMIEYKHISMLTSKINELNQHINSYGYTKHYNDPASTKKEFISASYINNAIKSLNQI